MLCWKKNFSENFSLLEIVENWSCIHVKQSLCLWLQSSDNLHDYVQIVEQKGSTVGDLFEIAVCFLPLSTQLSSLGNWTTEGDIIVCINSLPSVYLEGGRCACIQEFRNTLLSQIVCAAFLQVILCLFLGEENNSDIPAQQHGSKCPHTHQSKLDVYFSQEKSVWHWQYIFYRINLLLQPRAN